jgi:hypothetical protein
VLLVASSVPDTIAVAALVIAIVAAAGCAALGFTVRKLRAAQSLVLGPQGSADVVAHAVAMQREVTALRDYLDDVATSGERQFAAARERIDGAIASRGLVRYDAYGEVSGHQSVSIALLDGRKSGIVLSSILHRDQARLYAKQVRDGEADVELSPEEAEALRLALSGND